MRISDWSSDVCSSDLLDGYHRFRLYAPRILRLLDMQAAPIATPLLAAVAMLRNGIKVDPPVDFLRPNSKWHRHLRADPSGDHRLWEIAVLFPIRRPEEHTSELPSLIRTPYAVFCLK